MRRSGIRKLKDDEELGERLLPGADNNVETMELTKMAKRRSSGGTPSPQPAEAPFVWHILESHHTLAGIALQYRVSKEQLMRLNQLTAEIDLHTLAKIKIPAREYGVLLENPDEYRSKEAGTSLFTTALPVKAEDEEIGPKPTFIKDDDEKLEADPDASATPQSFLSSFDNDMKSAIAKMDDTITKTLANTDDPQVHIRTAHSNEPWGIEIKDWRVAVLAVSAVFLVSFSTYFLYHMVRADDGVSPGGSPTSHGHSSGNYLW